MTPEPDPMARLRASNPVPGDLLLRAHESETAQALFRAIAVGSPAQPVVTPAVAPASRPHRRLRLVGAAVAASLTLGGVAWAILASRVSKPQTVACYQRADLQARTAVVAARAGSAIESCADLWARGFGSGPAPAMAACVLPSGVLGVFPTTTGDDVCAGLRLAVAPGEGPTEADARFLAFRDAVLDELVGRGCVDPAEAGAVVRRELDRAGLADWAVRTGQGVGGEGFSASRPCAGLAFHPDLGEVVLVPSPPAG